MSLNIANVLILLAKRWPDKSAIESASCRLTYQALIAFSSAISNILYRHGVRHGSRVGIACTRNEDALVIMLSLWLLNATAFIIDFRTRASERSRLAKELDIIFFVEDKPAPGASSYPAVNLNIHEYYDDSERINLSDPAVIADQNSIALIGVSSGTTGIPKPVAFSHKCLFIRSAMARTSVQWNPGGRFVISTPLAFSASRKHVLSRLLDGGTVIFLPLMSDSKELAEYIISSNVDSTLLVPSVIRELLSYAPDNGLLFPNLRWLMSCGAPMSGYEKLLARSRLSHNFIQNYGSTMAGMITLLGSSEISDHSDTVGKPLAHVVVEIVDSDGVLLPAEQSGYIRVRTPGVAQELTELKNDSEKKSDVIIDGWIYTGDIGSIDKEGYLSVIGRADDTIIRGGVNIYPAEVEHILVTHPGVKEAAVVGKPDAVLGEEIAAFVVLSKDINTSELYAWCRTYLHPDKQPRIISIIDSLPKNTNGKLNRMALVTM